MLTHFEQIIANEDHLHSAQAYLKEIENTFLFPTPTNFQKLKTLGHQASFMSSVRWKALGCAMVVLGGALVAMACLYMNDPRGSPLANWYHRIWDVQTRTEYDHASLFKKRSIIDRTS